MKDNSNPKVSAIVTVFNGGKYLAESLQSILDQDYQNIEIVVINDGSTDNTAEVADKFAGKISYHYQKNSGIAAAKNLGLEKSTGEYLSFLDADDVWLPGKTSAQLDFLLKNPGVNMVFSHVIQFYSPELADDFKQKYICPAGKSPGLNSTVMLIRREDFFKVGLFDLQWRKGIFNDWFLRAVEKELKWEMLPEVMLKRRIHETNHGIVNRDKSVDYVRMLKASLDRKRKMG